MADLVTMAINAAKGKRGEAIYDPLLKPAAPPSPPNIQRQDPLHRWQ